MLETVVSDRYRDARYGLIPYHTDLERAVCAGRINEPLLERRLDELEKRWPFRDALYWLSVARINELALYCAGNYADSLEFSAAGDLLVNPRLVLVYTRNKSVPVKKDRHTPLTVQFGAEGTTDPEVRTWLRDNAIVQVKEQPLLHHLYEELKSSGWMAQHYLSSVRESNEAYRPDHRFSCGLENFRPVRLDSPVRQHFRGGTGIYHGKSVPVRHRRF